MHAADAAVHIPNDSVMAPPAFIRQVQDWAREAFAGERPRGRRLTIRVLRQDHSVLRFGRSCIETPLRIGPQSFGHGLGTHAFSDIAIEVPPGAMRFEAAVGVDNNHDTGGTRGSVEFAVQMDGDETLRTPVLKCGSPPVPVVVRVPAEARELRLQVTDGGDGAGYDQADWADARFVMSDGSERYLDAEQPDLPMADAELPLSFTLGGKPSRESLPTWKREAAVAEAPAFTTITATWHDPSTRMALIVEARAFKRYPAVDWVAWFENQGQSDSPLLENVQAMDMRLASGFARLPVQIHHPNADTCSATSFEPLTTNVEPDKPVHWAPTGGRPSSMTAFPFWNVQYGDAGLITGIGWTGQWQATFTRSPVGPAAMQAGMESLKTILHPGERIRTPRMLVMAWQGERTLAHVRFRRLMLEHFVPAPAGRAPLPPIAIQCFDRYNSRPGWATESGQLVYARLAADLGFDSVWLDAAWFPGGFPNGVGSWQADAERFPRGLKPIGDAVHERKMRFVVWFEPERVAPGSEIARDHPEWVFGGAAGGLYKLNDPAARKWLTDLLIERIGEFGVDVYPHDFNMDPLTSWRSADPPDRHGMTEIRYVEGLYEMWNAIRARYPGILIDNCSSGGRRLDLEMAMRSVPLWRSDTGCWAGHPEWNQMQSLALAQYLPLFTVGLWSPDPYERRSAATAGSACEVPYLDGGYDPAEWQEAVREIIGLRHLWLGDLYPITGASVSDDQASGWQLHRPDTGEGAIYLFRRSECSLAGLVVSVRAVEPRTRYRLRTIADDGKQTTATMTGKEMRDGVVVRMPKPRSSVIVRYAPETRNPPAKGATRK